MTGSQRRLAVILHDLFMVSAAWTLAYVLRFDFSSAALAISPFVGVLTVLLPVQALILWHFGLYRGLWHFASVPDLWNIIRAVALGVLASSLLLFLFNRYDGVPRSSVLLYPMFLVFLLGAPRLAFRVWKDKRQRASHGTKAQTALIIGTGYAGESLAREMLRDGRNVPVAFLSEQTRLIGSKVHGLPVLGGIDDVERVARELSVDLVVIAVPAASGGEMREIVSKCEATKLPYLTLPRVQDLVAGPASVKALREVAIDDLLGREPVSLKWDAIREHLAGKTIMVTGAGGSIGSELCRQIALLEPAAMVLVEHNEFNLYSIDRQLRGRFPNLIVHACLGSVADTVAVEHFFQEFKPDVVFHAAAYKHVPLLEGLAREAAKNNIIGTKVIAEAADRHGSSTFVLISTDKAVNPTNVMGASKRVAEILCQSLNQQSETRFITVRFGNVLGSAGSVVPLFKEQIASGGPVTVTHPEIRRYFMTITEACQLIMQASAMGAGGEIFVLDMGQQIKITYLAEQLIRLSGKRPGVDIEIQYTGLRPGEKLFEELFHHQEMLSGTTHEKILLARARATDPALLEETLDSIQSACSVYDESAINRWVRKLVPELSEASSSVPRNVVRLEKLGT